MSDPPADRELERLRVENAALNEQVKLLVRTEQRLYRSQNDLDAQLGRVRALAGFALESAGDADPAAILGRTLELLAATFRIDWAAAYRLDARGPGMTLIHTLSGPLEPGLARSPGDAARQWLERLAAPETIATGRPPAHPAWDLVRAVAPDAGVAGTLAELETVVLPLGSIGDGDRGVIAVLARRRPTVFLRDSIVAERHLPFLQLIAQHTDRAIENVRLTENLRDRSAQLTASLRTLELTQHQLLQAQKMEAIGRLAGGVAHDFNNLLTVILGYAGALETALPPEAPEREDARRILEAGRSAAGITSQLLALGRRLPQRLEHVDLSAEVARTADMLRLLVREDIRLEEGLEPVLRPVHVDRAQLEQVILNLVVNARDAMPGGGVLWIRTRLASPDDTARCEVPCDPAAFAVLEVTDSGHGMDDATRARAFEPFFTTKGAGKGNGLGLSVVYGIVKQNAGHILLDSEPGRGSRFVVMLPYSAPGAETAAPVERLAPATGAAGRGTTGAGATVLVVEDEAQIREVLLMALQAAGFSAFAVPGGSEAIAWIEARRSEPDLVLTDVVMPGMGGFELEQELGRRWPHLRVAFMSGYSEDLAAGGGRRAFLPKPFTPRELFAFLSAEIGSRAAVVR